MRIPARLLASGSLQCDLIGFISAQAASLQAQGTRASARKAPDERSEVTVAALGDKAYVIGDYNAATEILIYDLAHDSWSKGTAFPHAVQHASAVGFGGLIYVFGGYVDGWTATNEVWAFNPSANTWTKRVKSRRR